jgi:phosphatidylglycerol:prolipoprotein diacylglycerol transferase
VTTALFIPWFRLTALQVPLPFTESTLDIQPFGVLVAVGVLLGMRVVEWFAQKHDLDVVLANEFIGYVVLPGFLCAYFLNALFYHPEYIAEIFEDPSTLFSRFFGLSSYGGFIGAVLGALVWKRKRKESLLSYGDATTFALPFGWLFGRTGCFVVHDHPGAITDFPLAVADYQVGAPPFMPRHDLGFYEVLWSLATVALLWYLGQKRRPRGFFLVLVPLLYTPIRFFLDFLRATDIGAADRRYSGLTPAQYASIVFFVVASYVLFRIVKRGDPPAEGASAGGAN